MNWKTLSSLAAILAVALAQAPAKSTITNLATAAWERDKDSESVMLHRNESSGAMDLLVRSPPGHVIAPHYHDSNERIIVVEGQLNIESQSVDPGGFAYLPAREVQRISCGSRSRCTFYLMWDGSNKTYSAK